MKFFLTLWCVLPLLAWARVGPDLSAGVDVEFFTKLRRDYAKAPGTKFFPTWDLDPDHQNLVDAYRKRDVDEVLKLADSWLKKCPVDAETHLRVAMCFKEKGDLPSYTYHLGVFYGLLQSLTSSGDGLTPQTAFVVISVAEEYALLREIGAKVERQSLLAEGPCDRMDVSRAQGRVKSTYYFNVAIPFEATKKALGGKE
jgi:hypothetical protein